MAESDVFYRRYRPAEFAEVIGQGPVVKSVKTLIKDRTSQAFLFTGPSGVGKTTIARIAAREFGCDESTILEIDAATHTGVDAMRAVKDTANYMPFGKVQAKAIIIDECHKLSSGAWDTILKATEEPPEHVCWFFCTTAPGKVPATLKTRVTAFALKPLTKDDLHDLLHDVCKAEKIELIKGGASLLVQAAKGSARQLLVDLAKCYTAKTGDEMVELLEAAQDSDKVLELCRLLAANKRTFIAALKVINELGEDVQPESVRIQVVNYMGAALKNAKTEKDAMFFLSIIGEFDRAYNQSDGIAPLLLSIGRVVFQGS